MSADKEENWTKSESVGTIKSFFPLIAAKITACHATWKMEKALIII
jgi:hypothetical protein